MMDTSNISNINNMSDEEFDTVCNELAQGITDATNEIVNQLMEAKQAYYNGTPIMSDDEFDKLEELLHHTDPDNAYFSIVGVNVKGSNKIKHDVPMLSCAKAKTVAEVVKWLNKINYTERLLCTSKVDGLSGSIKFVNGVISYITTRGDGVEGQQITWLKDYLNIPQQIPANKTMEIRGEIYLPKDTKMITNGSPLRNIASGLVNRKENKTNCEYLKFIAYAITNSDNTKFSDDFEALEVYGFDVVPYYTIDTEDDIGVMEEVYISKYREQWNFETDGLVFQVNDKTLYDKINSKYEISHHNFYNIALKPESETAVTTLLGIDWQVSKQGNAIPVAYFEPIYLGNKEIRNATLNNYDNVKNLDLHEGDEVVIANANEVIPFFVKKNKSGNGKLLTLRECPSCGCLLTRKGVHLNCGNKDCPSQIIKTITDYCTRCEMDGVAESTIEKLYYDFGIHSIVELYDLENHYGELLNIEGFGASKIENLLLQIEKSKKQTEIQLISNLGIEGVHEKGLIKLGVDTLEKWEKFTDTTSVNGQKIITFLKENKSFVDKMFSIITPIQLTKTKSLGKVCMTGKGHLGRKELEDKLIEMGYEPVDGIGKDTLILVCEDVNGTSSKLDKARKNGTKIVSYEEFFK